MTHDDYEKILFPPGRYTTPLKKHALHTYDVLKDEICK